VGFPRLFRGPLGLSPTLSRDSLIPVAGHPRMHAQNKIFSGWKPGWVLSGPWVDGPELSWDMSRAKRCQACAGPGYVCAMQRDWGRRHVPGQGWTGLDMDMS
jgi:hypothetical protein